MIKFFRKIRQKLLFENRSSKYLLYAIGEIILVVIGILIALQINNWNEDRKLQLQELDLLTELQSNLEVTLNNFERDTMINLASINDLRKIEHYISEDLPYNNDLDDAFSAFGNWASPYPITTAYTTLQTKGLDLISNSALRNKIVHMYEYEYVILMNDYDLGEWRIIEIANLFLIKHIQSQNSNQPARPNDFEFLKDQPEFSNILSKIISQRELGLKMYKTNMSSTEVLIGEINEEIDSRKTI